MASQYFGRTSGGVESGPFSSSRLLEMIRSGELCESDWVRQGEGGPWVRVGSVPKLRAEIPTGAVDDFGISNTVEAEEAAGGDRAVPPKAPSPRHPSAAGSSAAADRVRTSVAKAMAWSSEEAQLNEEMPEPISSAWFDRLLDTVRGVMTASKFELLARWLTARGHLALMLGAGVALVYFVVNAVKMDSLSGFAVALAVPVAVLAGQYVAAKFINVGRAVLAQTPGVYRSKHVFNVISLCYILLAASEVAAAIWGFIQVEQLAVLVVGFAIALGLVITSTCFLYPAVLGLSLGGSGRAGAEAVSLIGAVLRSFVAMSPILYGTFSLCGGGLVAYSLVRLMMAGWTSLEGVYYHLAIVSAMGILAIGCAIPLIAYFLFLLLFLQLDAISAVFEIAEQTKTPKSSS